MDLWQFVVRFLSVIPFSSTLGEVYERGCCKRVWETDLNQHELTFYCTFHKTLHATAQSLRLIIFFSYFIEIITFNGDLPEIKMVKFTKTER